MPPAPLPSAKEENRKEFLLKMYEQMFKDIEHNLSVIWQSVTVLAGSFAILALAEKNVVSVDFASALIILIAIWLLAHLHNSSYWYNRNLVIISNIEKQFLHESDMRDIQYYFGQHRKDNRMIETLQTQYAFGIGIIAIVIIYHFSGRVWGGIGNEWKLFQFQRVIPYIVLVVGIGFLINEQVKNKRKYLDFLTKSPGIDIDSTGYGRGIGHSFKDSEL